MTEFRQDKKEKLVSVIADPQETFQSDPMAMMELIILAADLDFDIPKGDYEAMLKNAPRLPEQEPAKIREAFLKIITATHAGKGLRMLAGADLMPAVIGDVAGNLTARQRQLFSDLADGIDKTKKNPMRSLGLFYLCFEKKGLQAIERLDYDRETHQHLTDALTQMEKIFFLSNGVEFKKYLRNMGMERYLYLHNLAKAQHIVYGKHDFKVENRDHLLEKIREQREPIFLQDLAITEQDLVEAGITTQDRASDLLNMLLDVVHNAPHLNTRAELLTEGKKLSKSKIRAMFRGVKWMK